MMESRPPPRSVNPVAIADVETLRSSYRPERITTLFVGESAPISGAFFYDGDNSMVRYMQRAVAAALPGEGNFLDRFKSYGWYLDDLVLTPINKLTLRERRAAWRDARDSLAKRIAEYQPLAIVVLLKGMARTVDGARAMSGVDAASFVVPFPGMSHQNRFHDEMQRIIALLPRVSVPG